MGAHEPLRKGDGDTISPFRSSTLGLLGRLSEKLVLAANLPPSTTSWDTSLRPLVSGGRQQKEERNQLDICSTLLPAPWLLPNPATSVAWTDFHRTRRHGSMCGVRPLP